MTDAVVLVEVGPRDGFQSVGPFIPTPDKLAVVSGLYKAGIRRMEVTSFVSATALPQMADAAEVMTAAAALEGLDVQVLVPNARHARRALDAGSRHLSFVVSVSEQHNFSNVRQTPRESIKGFNDIVAMSPKGTKMRLNLATAFDCPFAGPVASDLVLDCIAGLLEYAPDGEIALCDTTGRATPDQVTHLFSVAMDRFKGTGGWVFHGHDTYGLGAANALAAYNAGVRIFDSSIAGLGGCPFAPGATGNVATEDLVWMFSNMGVLSAIDLALLLSVGAEVCALPGAQVGGRVRVAEQAREAKRNAA